MPAQFLGTVNFNDSEQKFEETEQQKLSSLVSMARTCLSNSGDVTKFSTVGTQNSFFSVIVAERIIPSTNTRKFASSQPVVLGRTSRLMNELTSYLI